LSQLTDSDASRHAQGNHIVDSSLQSLEIVREDMSRTSGLSLGLSSGRRRRRQRRGVGSCCGERDKDSKERQKAQKFLCFE
jgi:hypothetical protein